MSMFKTYTELSKLKTFNERYEYLKLDANVGSETFGYDRYLNQMFYRSPEWKRIRNSIIIRDNGCDLGVEGCEIYGKILIHHMNPITIEDIKNRSSILLDPEYMITTTLDTHNAIHYSNENMLEKTVVERTMNDTCPWRNFQEMR